MDYRIKRRAVLFTVIVCLFCVAFIGVVCKVQFSDAEAYSENKNVKTYEVSVDASRGEILDRNGKALVTNRQGNRIIFNGALFPYAYENEKRNAIIISLINLCEANNTEWTDNLPLVFDDFGKIQFVEKRESDIKALKSKNMLNLNEYADAQNCMDALIEMYELENYSLQEARKIASVRYEMWRTAFSVSNPYVFADDVSIELVSLIRENNGFYEGVESEVVTYREYSNGKLACHILGVIGSISDTEYEEKNEEYENAVADDSISQTEKKQLELNAYTLNDTIGKFGIESAMEEYLRGKKGIKTVSIDEDNNVSYEYTVSPVQGNTVMLTIDAGMQSVAEEALKSRILELTASEGLEAAGAVVVQNVNTGEILASASYPDYDLSTYYDNYDKLASDSASPLWNRVLQSTYEPGSTMKPAMAIAALECKVITEQTKFYCNSVFKYLDTEFNCLHSHGNINVITAIEQSCNIFFYNVAEKLGIDKMNEYSRKLGLGSKTGTELYEATGILAGKAYRESIGSIWNPGDTIQAAIGQSDNQFTLIQLCNYCATIANGGTRYTPHFIKSIVSYDYSDTILEKDAVVAEETGISKSTIDIVKRGMLSVATNGSCYYTFSPLQYQVAAKTGTTQIKKVVNGNIVKGNNGFIMAFGPYEDPEIAIAVVVENIDSGTATAKVAADIFEYYFSSRSQVSTPQKINTFIY